MRVHTNEKPFVCSECGLSYSSRSSLYNHKKIIHSDFKQERNLHINANNYDITNDNVTIKDSNVSYKPSVNSDPDVELVERRHFKHEMKCETTFMGMYVTSSLVPC